MNVNWDYLRTWCQQKYLDLKGWQCNCSIHYHSSHLAEWSIHFTVYMEGSESLQNSAVIFSKTMCKKSKIHSRYLNFISINLHWDLQEFLLPISPVCKRTWCLLTVRTETLQWALATHINCTANYCTQTCLVCWSLLHR